MKIKNRIGLGVLLGLPLPIIAHILTNYSDLVSQLMPSKPSGLYILAGAFNLIGAWVAYRNEKEELGKGIVLITFLGMLLAVFTKTVVI